jgi:hypothetical protein
MSQIVQQFDPSQGTKEFTAPNGAANGALVFWNESNISVELTFSDSTNMYLPAWYHRKKCGATGSVNVALAVNTMLNQANPPMSAIVVEAYASGESTPNDGPLVRQTNGNVQATVTQTNLVNSTGLPPATIVVFAVPSGDNNANGAVNLNNIGQFTLGDSLYNGSLLCIGTDTSEASLTHNALTLFGLSNNNVQIMTSVVSINGGTSGTATLYQDFQGAVKRVLIVLSNFRTGAANQTIALPTPFISNAKIDAGGIGTSAQTGGMQLLNGGVAQNIDVVTALAALGGTRTSQTTIYQYSFGYTTHPFDTIQFPLGSTVAYTGTILIEGN